jgi:hypothetical protein
MKWRLSALDLDGPHLELANALSCDIAQIRLNASVGPPARRRALN